MSLRDVTVAPDVPKLQMTPMIDIVFNLLAFFIITFKIPTVEGDFNIKMPVNAQSTQSMSMEELTPIEITLKAGPSGELTGILFGSKPLGTDMKRLRAEVFDYLEMDVTGTLRHSRDDSENQEVEFDCDEALHYGYLMDAITAVTGYVNDENQIVKLIEKIKFTPPQ